MRGTVDYLREIAPGREGGAYLRAILRPGGGSVLVMTLPLVREAERAAARRAVNHDYAGLWCGL